MAQVPSSPSSSSSSPSSHDVTHLTGVFQWANGERYEGEYRDDKKEGMGVYTWPSGARYEGQYLENKRHGKGTYLFASGERAGDSYTGEWVANNMDGKGTYSYKNTDVYVGGFLESKQHGPGELSTSNGELWLVRYDHGKEVSRVHKEGRSPRKATTNTSPLDVPVNIPSTVEDPKLKKPMQEHYVRYVWRQRGDEERTLMSEKTTQGNLIRDMLGQCQEKKKVYQSIDMMTPLVRILVQLIAMLEKMLGGRPLSQQGDLVQLLKSLRVLCADLSSNRRDEEAGVVSDVVGSLERLGHAIFDVQIREGVFRARCNIEEAINLGNEAAATVKSNPDQTRAQPHTKRLAGVGSFLERFMVEEIQAEALSDQADAVQDESNRLHTNSMERPGRLVEQMHNKMTAGLDALRDQNRAKDGRELLLQASVPQAPPPAVEVDGLTAQQASRSKALFTVCDTDGSHAVEVGEILVVFGANIALDYLAELIDLENDGLIDLEEWQVNGMVMVMMGW